MRSIYILLTRSKTIASRMIHMVTEAPYTHSSLSFGDDLEQLYSFGRKYTHLPLPAGLRIESLDKGFFKAYSDIPCTLYEYRIPADAYDRAKAIVDDMIGEQSRYRYSMLGLLYCRMGWDIDRGDKYFCSEFIAEVLEKSGAMPLPKVPRLIKPIDFAHLPGAIRHYEGNVGDLFSRITERLAEENEVIALD